MGHGRRPRVSRRIPLGAAPAPPGLAAPGPEQRPGEGGAGAAGVTPPRSRGSAAGRAVCRRWRAGARRPWRRRLPERARARLVSTVGARRRWDPGGWGEGPQAQCASASAQAAAARPLPAQEPGDPGEERGEQTPLASARWSHPETAPVPRAEAIWIRARKTACLSWRLAHLRRKGMRGEVACGTPLGLLGFWPSLGAAPGPACPFPAVAAGPKPRGVCVWICPAGQGVPGQAWPRCAERTDRAALAPLAPALRNKLETSRGFLCSLWFWKICGAARLCLSCVRNCVLYPLNTANSGAMIYLQFVLCLKHLLVSVDRKTNSSERLVELNNEQLAAGCKTCSVSHVHSHLTDNYAHHILQCSEWECFTGGRLLTKVGRKRFHIHISHPYFISGQIGEWIFA